GIFILISLQTQSAGQIGKFVRQLLRGFFSSPASVLPYFIILFGILSIIGKINFIDRKFKVAMTVSYISLVAFYTVYHSAPEPILTLNNLKSSYVQGVEGIGGGIIGNAIAGYSVRLLGRNGSYVFLLTVMLISFMIITGMSLVTLLKRCKVVFVKLFSLLKQLTWEFIHISDRKQPRDTTKKSNKSAAWETSPQDSILNKESQLEQKIKILDFTKNIDAGHETEEFNENMNHQKKTEKVEEKKEDIDELNLHIQHSQKSQPNYQLPGFDLLDEKKGQNLKNDNKDILYKAKILEQTLQNFGVEAKVIQVSKGPTITRYEIQPSPGVKVSKIVNLADDIALNLAASNIRIEAPIPGKAAVGIEVPNQHVSPVTLREVLESEEFQESKSKLVFALGKDIAGNPVCADLTKMPHLLIAGSTGSGKSVCVNAIIHSILYKATPAEVKLLLIDPKVVELSNYNGIPHLLIPVVTDPKKASTAIHWAVQEMTDRYKAFAKNNVRDIDGYNEKMKKENKELLPKIVVIIDELADLMMVAPGQVEDGICRLAQMARAAGIHLIIATQRPSVDVLTGVIKANIPSRIAFAVSSQVDSRTILDMSGAEKLLGKGDMLFYPVGASKPKRVQGAFISEAEVERVVQFIKSQNIHHEYDEGILENMENDSSQFSQPPDDLLEDAIEAVVEAGQASVSMLQRRFRIGYNRAARIIDSMEERGIVGASEGSKPRQVLITKEELAKMKTS
ncbi:MAG TPA: DNA translocase FtsK, partial [Clostridiales bacterium]|nr:DNA translocase FtsK [Clostridiales bacterium]